MHRSSSNVGGGYFKGSSIFGRSKTPTTTRPPTRDSTSTSNASAVAHAHSESTNSSTTSRSSGFSRKASTSKSPKNLSRTRSNSTSITDFSPEKKVVRSAAQTELHPLLTANGVLTQISSGAEDKLERVTTYPDKQSRALRPDSVSSITPYSNMLARPGTGYSGQTTSSNIVVGAYGSSMQPSSPTLETITFQHIQETSSKRISTLDYLRKAHEGRVYWFNTLLFNKPDLQRMPYFDARKLARRATNYLLLGLSLPTIIDLNGSNAVEFLKTLNALLSEFETFQQIHPPDGSSSLSRGRFPQMFKRAATTATKGRRQSSAAEIGLPMGIDYSDSKSSNGNTSTGGTNPNTSFSITENDLQPGEEYTHLLTPSLPFDPDFYETFATLCDVLIDCYTKLMSLVSSPRECSPAVAEMFTKADARVRKIIVQGVVKEFEDSSRGGVKSEVAGVGRVVLGGLL
ncbi:hypothetical protein B0O99DRAFT_510380 [Bisporella sp. PMI_857]|nr:hypothetical protein B0O99DRAFT_510380 [Bisporella sp. PMI_857]